MTLQWVVAFWSSRSPVSARKKLPEHKPAILLTRGAAHPHQLTISQAIEDR
jgi:hypothetical protein